MQTGKIRVIWTEEYGVCYADTVGYDEYETHISAIVYNINSSVYGEET